MEHKVSYALWVLQEPIQYVCLAWMATLYAIKIRQLLKRPFPPEKGELKGDRTAGVIQSLTNVLRPWSMESTRTNMYFYVEFVIFHIAVVLTISSTFLIPLTPWLMIPLVTKVIMVFMGLAFLIGLRRIIRRLFVPQIKVITTFDDMFAIILMTTFFLVGFITMNQWLEAGSKPIDTTMMWIFFGMVTFFLLYVPFSKISHYVLYPFGRINFGMVFGGRGILNKGAANPSWVPK